MANRLSLGVNDAMRKIKDDEIVIPVIAELFRRLNDGGTPLSSYDLVASMFKGFDYKPEGILDTAVAENTDIGIGQDAMIKLLLILNDKPAKDVSEVTADDADFATANFERISESLKTLKAFLISTGNYNWFAREKNRSAIPLYFLAYHIFHSNAETQALNGIFNSPGGYDYRSMALWLRLSLLNKVFSRGCGWIPCKTGIKQIHSVVQRRKNSFFPADELIAMYTDYPLRFCEKVFADNLDCFDREYMFYLLYDGQPSIQNADTDHIHPRYHLMKAGFDEQKINSAANFQILDTGTNRGSKNGRELYMWIESYIDPANRHMYLSRHLIPDNPRLWKSAAFEDFLRERSILLAEKIRSFL